MSTIADPVKGVMVPLIHYFKDHLDKDLSYAVRGELKTAEGISKLIAIKGNRFSGDVMELELIFHNGFASCRIKNANGLSQIHPAARNKKFLAELEAALGKNHPPNNGDQKVGKQGYVSANARPH